MTKISFYLALLLLPLVAFISCDDTKDDIPYYSELGEWVVYERRIECTGSDEESNIKAKKEQDVMNAEFKKQLKTTNCTYEFSTFTSQLEPNYYEYLMKKESEGGKILSGNYERKMEAMTAVIAQGPFGNWRTNMVISDLNKDFMMLTQDLDSDDLYILYYLYFGGGRKFDPRIKAKMVTKAWKRK